MLVFIDESGDAGFKLGSSLYLSMAMVIFDDYSAADATRDTIKQLSKDMRIKPEFRFANCSNIVRSRFFDVVNQCQFRVRGIVINKEAVHSHYLRNHPAAFYNYTLRQLVVHNQLYSAKVRIDGSATRPLQKAIYTDLRKELSIGTIDNLKFIDSKDDPLIQLADMVVGAIARPYKYPGVVEASTWINIIKGKIEHVEEYE